MRAKCKYARQRSEHSGCRAAGHSHGNRNTLMYSIAFVTYLTTAELTLRMNPARSSEMSCTDSSISAGTMPTMVAPQLLCAASRWVTVRM